MSVFAESAVNTLPDVFGNVIVVPSVPLNVIELLTVSVFPAVTLSPVTEVAAIVPDPVTPKLPPVPINNAAVFVPAVIELNAGVPPESPSPNTAQAEPLYLINRTVDPPPDEHAVFAQSVTIANMFVAGVGRAENT